MYLGTAAISAEIPPMVQPVHIFDMTCRQCGLPALTFDENGNALCVQHATVFIAAGAAEDEDEDDTP
jgi:hypothetical protein